MISKLKSLPKNVKRALLTTFLTTCVFIIVLSMDSMGNFTWLERKVNDFMLKNRPRENMPIRNDIILVGMDDESIEQIGRWPWNRSVFAEFLRFVKRGNPRAVLFDIEFLEKFTRNSKAEKYHLFDNLEIWYEGLAPEIKAQFSAGSDEAVLRLIQDYGNYCKEPRPFPDASITDDDYLAESLKIIGKAYLAMHFSEELIDVVYALRKQGNFDAMLRGLSPDAREQVYKDYIIYRKIEQRFDLAPDEISRETKLSENYIKTRLFDIRNNYVQDLADEIIMAAIGKSATVEVDFNSVRNDIFKKIGITSEIDLVRKNILVGIEDIIMDRITLFQNVRLISQRDTMELPEQVAAFFRNPEKPSIPILPVQKLLRNTFTIGFANNAPDDDGVYRRHPLFFELDGEFVPQISIKVAEQAMNLDFKSSRIVDGFLKVPIGSKEFSDRIGPELSIPLNADRSVLFNWAARYDDPTAFRNASFYSHFFNLMQIEKGVYSFLARILCEGLDDDSVSFFRAYHAIRSQGLTVDTIAKLTPILPGAFANLDDIGEKLMSAFARPNLSFEQIKRLKKRSNDIFMTKYQLNSFKNNIIGPENLIDSLKDKILIIGLSAHATSDVKPTPVGAETPMFFGHANILNAMFQNRFIRYAETHHSVLLTLLMSALSCAILTLLHPGSAFVSTLAAIAAYFYFSFFMFAKTGVFFKVMAPLIILLANFTVITLFFYFSEEREKQFIRQAFSHYLSPNAMEDVLSDPDKLSLKGERRHLTVLFSDVRSFTTFSENHTPEEVVAMLNEYLDYMTEIVFKYKGTLDKYVGDELMAVYGAPSKVIQTDHAARALFSCFEMMDVLHDLQQKWVSEGKQAIDIGIGFNTGDMIVGNMGSNKHFDYTVIGDHVNLGARVEALTRNYNNHIIFTEFSLEYLKDLCEYKYLDNIKVKGKNKPVSIYEPTALTPKGIEEMMKFGPRLKIAGWPKPVKKT